MITMPRIIISITMVGVYFLNWRCDKVGFLFHATSATLWALFSFEHSTEQSLTYAFSAFSSIVGYIRWKEMK